MRVVVVVVVEGRRGLGETGMLNKRNRIEHLRGTNLGVAQPRPQDSPMFYKKKKQTQRTRLDVSQTHKGDHTPT